MGCVYVCVCVGGGCTKSKKGKEGKEEGAEKEKKYIAHGVQ